MDSMRYIALLCVCAVALTAIGIRDVGDVLAGDFNGDHRVDVLDLQAIITVVLHETTSGNIPGLGDGARVNVLDFQRVLALAERTGRSNTTPPARPDCKMGYFRCQTGWVEAALRPLMAPLEHKEALGIAEVSVSLARRFERPVPWRLPPITERYLFHLTSNAPPVCA